MEQKSQYANDAFMTREQMLLQNLEEIGLLNTVRVSDGEVISVMEEFMKKFRNIYLQYMEVRGKINLTTEEYKKGLTRRQEILEQIGEIFSTEEVELKNRGEVFKKIGNSIDEVLEP